MDGRSTLKKYLNAQYSVKYYTVDGNSEPVEATNATDSQKYVKDQGVANTTINPGLFTGGGDDPVLGDWKVSNLQTKLTLKDNVPSGYSDWYTTQDGTVKHTGPYAGVNIKTVAESSGNGTPTIVECYATKDKPGLSVNKTIHLINSNTNVSSVQTVNVDDTIVYKIEVENTRNVTLSDINVSDTLTKDSTSGSSLTLYSDETCTTEFPELSLWLLMPAKHCMPNTP